MIGNYFRFLFRDLKRNPGYLSINIAGLAVGLATVILIVLYIQHELSFDEYHENKNNLYRITSYSGFGEKSWGSYIGGDPIPEMRNSFTGVEDATKFQNFPGYFKDQNGDPMPDIKVRVGESNAFNMFSFGLLEGDPVTVIDAPNTAVISQSLATRLFGNESPIGKIIPAYVMREDRDIQITGIMNDIPVNSHFTFDMLVSYETLVGTRLCLTCGQPMYVMVEDNADITVLEDQVLAHVRDVDGKTRIEDIKFEALTDIHFSSIYSETQGDTQYVFIMSGIAILVLLIGCANYMNLATARFSQRSKEIGVRKVLGAMRMELIKQFYLEAVILTVVSLPLALILLTFALPYFNELANASLEIKWLQNYVMYVYMIGLLFLIGLLAGSYPALFLSAFRPSEVIKGDLKLGLSGSAFRKGLVVFQFLVCIIMLVVTGIIMQQLNFMQNKKLGFDTEQVMYASLNDPALSSQYKIVKERLAQNSNIQSIYAGTGTPMMGAFGGARFIHRMEDDPEQTIEFINPTIDSGFLETLSIELVAGRNISDELGTKKVKIGTLEFTEREILINEASVKAMGWESPEAAVGQLISSSRVVGVTKDFHAETLHKEIGPLMMQQNEWGFASLLVIKTTNADIAALKETVASVWAEFGVTKEPEMGFIDEKTEHIYKNEKNTATTIGIFAFLSIFVGCLGLFGLATFMTEQRVKEIGIRKVLGASVSSIILLLFKDFGKLIIIAFFIAVPISFMISTEWLNNFAFKTSIGPSIFIVSGVIVLIISILSTGLRSTKAAKTNPVNVLRS